MPEENVQQSPRMKEYGLTWTYRGNCNHKEPDKLGFDFGEDFKQALRRASSTSSLDRLGSKHIHTPVRIVDPDQSCWRAAIHFSGDFSDPFAKTVRSANGKAASRDAEVTQALQFNFEEIGK